MKFLIGGVVALALLGAGAAYALTRPSGDIELGGGYASRAWDGARVVDPQEIGQPTRFAGNGTVVAIVMAQNMRDHAVEIAVPPRERARLAARGVRASVAFVPRGRVILNVERRDIDRAGATTMPAHADGSLVHIFRVIDCRRAAHLNIATLPLATDGHHARVDVSYGAGKRELLPYASEVIDIFRSLSFAGC